MVEIRSKDIRLVPIGEIKLNPKNRNSHSKEQIDRLAQIIKYQGFRNPGVVSNRTGILIAGEGRYLAAQQLGLEAIPCIFQDFDDETQEFTYGVSDNSISSWSELDLSGINADIGDFGPFDLDLLGIKNFTVDVADKLGECDEDEIPEHVEPRTKLGDIYKLGNHRLMCGDSTSIDAIEELLDGEKPEMVFTDPPYQLQTQGGGILKESSAMKGIKALGIDEFDPSTLVAHAQTSVFCCNKPLIPNYIKLAEDWGVSWDLAVYHKQNVTPNYGGHMMTDLEYIFIIGKQSPHTGMGEDKSLYSKLYSGGKDQDNETAWSKPVALCEKFIKLYSKKSVIDVFGGSGSTLIACEKINRKCFMMELSEKYCDVIVARWEKFTGQKAELLTQQEVVNG